MNCQDMVGVCTPLFVKLEKCDQLLDDNGKSDFSKRRSGRIRTKMVPSPTEEIDRPESPVPIRKQSKRKADETITLDEKPVKKSVRNGNLHSNEKLSRCTECRQYLQNSELRLFAGDPENAVEEIVMLTDPRLSLLNNDAGIDIDPFDERPQHKITDFSVYDKNTHLCPFDTGLIEKNVELYFSGYVKPIYDEDYSSDGGVPTRCLGPINEWWIAGFDGGEYALIGFSTEYSDYILMAPSDDYKPFMEILQEKIYLTKIVIEFVDNNREAELEDLLNRIQVTVKPKGLANFTEDTLLRHAQFIVDQVQSYDAGADEDEATLLVTPCMRSLIKLAGVTLGIRRTLRRREKEKIIKPKKIMDTKAMTTPLVRNIFENFFPEQIDQDKAVNPAKRHRCGVCEACQQPDCGKCSGCRGMLKFGGSGKSKQACVGRRCPNMVVKAADEDEQLDESDDSEMERLRTSRVKRSYYSKETEVTLEWTGNPVKKVGSNTYYDAVTINENLINIGDCVMVKPDNPETPVFVAAVMSMWENAKEDKCYFHAQWFIRGSDTVLGETSDPLELFLVDQCEDVSLACVSSKCSVVWKAPPPNWSMLGGMEESGLPVKVDDGKSFYYQKWYDPDMARFEDPPCIITDIEDGDCPTCEKVKKTEEVALNIESECVDGELSGILTLNGVKHHVGDCVYLNSEKYNWFVDTRAEHPDESYSTPEENKLDYPVDEEMYPESYRKTSDQPKWKTMIVPKPFAIGCIVSIASSSGKNSNPKVRVKKFYRPESTYKVKGSDYGLDMNCIFWSNEECDVLVECIMGKCYVSHSDNIDDLEAYRVGGPNRFYFSAAYSKSNKFEDPPPSEARAMGSKPKGKGKGKSSTKRYIPEMEKYPTISQPLRSLDLFAGCGGLSEGFHQSGVAKTMWAIEKDAPAAQAFRLNNPDSTVFLADVNDFLRMVVDGESCDALGQKLPRKGDVELLCGGPPCQGFSGMNRFNSRQYSLFKNSLVVSLLSFCDYYRPRFFVLENVRNFVAFKKSMVLKLALRCLIQMGYQCTFAVLQAGQYGIPQTRRRAIIIAAAPGEKLPMYPEPTHVFPSKVCKLSVLVNDVKFASNIKWSTCAPYHAVNVRDAMSDLPDIKEFSNRESRARYACDPITHFQTIMRGPKCPLTVSDHVCKESSGLILARLKLIPRNSDWRDLPNISVRLPDGSYTKKLMYTHRDIKNGKSSTGALRGVCACATGKPCDPTDHQSNTIIPWCLPHTGNRHSQWAGLYGRLEWSGFFSTTVTNPEPMGKQGRVLHPEYHRVVSVRECARSQGFRDTYRFFGSVIEKHRQIGNAVPPPMAAAIGMEIKRSVAEAEDC